MNLNAACVAPLTTVVQQVGNGAFEAGAAGDNYGALPHRCSPLSAAQGRKELNCWP